MTNPDVATPRTPEDAGWRLFSPPLAWLNSDRRTERAAKASTSSSRSRFEFRPGRSPNPPSRSSTPSCRGSTTETRKFRSRRLPRRRVTRRWAATRPTLPTLVPAPPRASDPPTIRSDRPPRTPRMRSSRTSPRRCWCNTWRTASVRASRGSPRHRVPGHLVEAVFPMRPQLVQKQRCRRRWRR